MQQGVLETLVLRSEPVTAVKRHETIFDELPFDHVM